MRGKILYLAGYPVSGGRISGTTLVSWQYWFLEPAENRITHKSPYKWCKLTENHLMNIKKMECFFFPNLTYLFMFRSTVCLQYRHSISWSKCTWWSLQNNRLELLLFTRVFFFVSEYVFFCTRICFFCTRIFFLYQLIIIFPMLC